MVAIVVALVGWPASQLAAVACWSPTAAVELVSVVAVLWWRPGGRRAPRGSIDVQ